MQSLYSRILARNPAIRGNKFNLALGGADVASMLLQARKAVALKPAPELVVVQGIDNDITCDTIGHRPFQVAFARVLDVLATGLPDARIFVVSQFGSVPTYIKALTLKQRVNQRLRISPGSGPCAFLDARGAAIPKGVAYLEAVIHRYEAAVASACKAVASCRYDGGAFGRIVERPEYISWDVIHLSAQARQVRSRRLGGIEKGRDHPKRRLTTSNTRAKAVFTADLQLLIAAFVAGRVPPSPSREQSRRARPRVALVLPPGWIRAGGFDRGARVCRRR